MKRPVIVDTNILFSALLSQNSLFADAILQKVEAFFICEFVVVELFKHKERIAERSKLNADELLLTYHTLLRSITIFKEDLISVPHRQKAFDLCHEIDPADIPHVALTLELNGLLWTGDRKLKSILAAKGFADFFSLTK